MGNNNSSSRPRKQSVVPDLRQQYQQPSSSISEHPGGRPLPQPPTNNLGPIKSIIPTKHIVRALYNYDSINEDDLSFKKGDLLEVPQDNEETADWWMVEHTKTGQMGFIPSNYVIKDDTSPQTQDWWFEIDRQESDKLLLLPGNPVGTFLVRGAKDMSSHVLSIRFSEEANGNPCVKHYKIHSMDGGAYCISPKKTFNNLVDLINQYQEHSDGICCRLSHVCPRTRPVVQFRDMEISRDVVKLSRKIGAGCFGDVWKGTLRRVVDVAVKTMQPGRMSAEAFLDEAKIMHKLTHRKLVQILAVVSVTEPFYIITEYMVNGALLDYLRSDMGKLLDFKALLDMNSQITEGMAYLEKVNFIHRDLRAANILVGENNEVKVADFGLARITEDGDYFSKKSMFPVKWTAPEAINERRFSIKSDIWSFGVLMYEIMTLGKTPYAGMPGDAVVRFLEKGRRLDKPKNGIFDVPDFLYLMMRNCWHIDPEQRPSFASLHNFFDDYLYSKTENT